MSGRNDHQRMVLCPTLCPELQGPHFIAGCKAQNMCKLASSTAVLGFRAWGVGPKGLLMEEHRMPKNTEHETAMVIVYWG